VKSASKKKRKTIVQYKTLVTEDDFAPLVEQVDPHLIGPLPRNIHWKMVGIFHENEVIDARDGWWSGVVKKVLDGECDTWFILITRVMFLNLMPKI
jgi:hypothetical protein